MIRRDKLIERLEGRVMLAVEPLDPSYGAEGVINLPTGSSRVATIDEIDVVAVAPDGKVVTAGRAGGKSIALVRQNADGSLDSTFGNNGRVVSSIVTNPDDVFDVAIQADGAVLIASTRFGVARFTAEGRLDASFGDHGVTHAEMGNQIYALEPLPDGKIIAVGAFLLPPRTFTPSFRVERLNADGSLDATFGAGGVAGPGVVNVDFGDSPQAATAVAVQADGKIVVAGVSRIVRLAADGQLDDTFGDHGKIAVSTMQPSLSIRISGVTTTSDGGIVVAAKREPSSGAYIGFVQRFNADGSPDLSFGESGVLEVNQSVPQAFTPVGDGGFLIGGSTSTDRAALVRTTPDGKLDPTFGQGGRAEVEMPARVLTDLALAPDGKIVVAGQADDFVTARLTSIGKLDTSFGGFGHIATDIGSVPSSQEPELWSTTTGRRYVTAYNSEQTRLVRLAADGSVDGSYSEPEQGGLKGYVQALDEDAEGLTVVRGDSSGAAFLQRLHLDGSPDAQFGPDGKRPMMVGDGFSFSGVARILPDRGALVGFTGVGGQIIARFNADASLDQGFGDQGILFFDQNDGPNQLISFADGSFTATGVHYGLQERHSWLKRFHADGSPDESFGVAGQAIIEDPGRSLTGLQKTQIGSDGRIFLVRGERLDKNLDGFVLYALTLDGRMDQSFGNGGRVVSNLNAPSVRSIIARSLQVRADESILISGSVVGTSGAQNGFVEAFESDGQPLRSFGVGGRIVSTRLLTITDLAAAEDGKLIATALEAGADSTMRLAAVARYLTTPVISLRSTETISTELRTPGYATTGAFIVERSGDLSKPLELRYSLGGTATLGLDYDLPADAHVIPAGADSIVIEIRAIDDAQAEGDEMVQLSFDAIPDGYQFVRGRVASVFIKDDDATDRFEPNNSIDAAAALGLNASEAGLSINRTGDEDWFRLRAVRGGWLQVDAQSSTLLGVVSIEAFDATGGGLGLSVQTSPRGQRLNLELIAGRDYFIKLTGPANPDYTLSTYFHPFSSIAAKLTYYRGARFNGGPFAGDVDDRTIASDKVAFSPGETPGESNITDFTAGLTGVMIDFAGLRSALDAADLRFRTLSFVEGRPTWAAAASDFTTMRYSAGVGGVDRMQVLFSGVINRWLEVTVPATPRTGLEHDEVFYFGNLVGDVGGSLGVNAADLVRLRNGVGRLATGVDDALDVNRDGRVDASDLVLVRNNVGHTLPPLTTPNALRTSIMPFRVGLRREENAEVAIL